MSDKPFRLAPADLVSPTWHKLKKHMEARLQTLRTKNDMDMDPIATAKLRGEIRAIKNLLALSEAAPAMGADEDHPE